MAVVMPPGCAIVPRRYFTAALAGVACDVTRRGGESDRSYSAPFYLEERRIDKDVMHILRFGTDIDRTGVCPSRQAERSGPLFAPNLLAFCAARVEHQSDLAICRGVGARLGHFQRCGE